MTAPAHQAVEAARRFHEVYERLAPQFGYKTREDTRQFDPESSNGKLMTAVCAELTRPQEADDIEDLRESAAMMREIGELRKDAA